MMAADSMRPLPSALATATLPATTLHQAGDAQQGLATQLQRVAEAVVDAAQDDVDLLQPVDGFEVHVTVADGQVGTFDECDVEVLGEVGMLEVGLVVRPGCEQDDARVGLLAQAGQGITLRPKEWRKAQDVRRREQLRQQVSDDACGFPARSRCQTVPGCGRRAPTTGRRASAPGPPQACAGSCARAPERRPAGAETLDCQRAAQREICPSVSRFCWPYRSCSRRVSSCAR